MTKNLLRIILASFLGLFSFSIHAQYLVSSEFLSTTSSNFLALADGIPNTYSVNYYKLTYNTLGTDGEPTVASGAIALPIADNCTAFPMAVYCHGTVLRRYDVPSENNLESIIPRVFASAGFITLAPDYLGLGENEGVHPYVHGESQATATIDLIRAANEFLEGQTVGGNGEVFITGYSQGGHAAMATLKYAQENDLNDELGIVAGAPCSGPYDLSGSQLEVLLSDEPYSNPGYVVYILIGYQSVYGNLYNDLGDVVQSPYDELVLPYFDGEQNQWDMGVVNNLLPNLISDLMVDTVLTNLETNPNHPIRLALEDNDNYDWAPEVPIRLYYCSGDEQVGFQNSLTAETTMNQNGDVDVVSENVLPGASHGACVLPALAASYSFFTSITQPCGVVSTKNQEVKHLDLYPNPTNGRVNLNTPLNSAAMLTVYDISGRPVMQKSYSGPLNSFSMESLAKGQYLISIESEEGIFRTIVLLQ